MSLTREEIASVDGADDVATLPGAGLWTAGETRRFREDAQAWEDHQTQCIRHGGGKEPDDPDAKWYGYIFRH